MEPKAAVEAFRRAKLLQPTYAWQDVWQEEHARMFAVAGVQRLDVLQIFQDEITEAIRTGKTSGQFADAVRGQLQAKGWWGDVETTDPKTGETRLTRFDDRRLSLIYDTNQRQAYSQAKWERFQRSDDLERRLREGRIRRRGEPPAPDRPSPDEGTSAPRSKTLLMYITMNDGRVRAAHQAWHRLVLPLDHAFWDTHTPINAYGCRCTVRQVSEEEVAAMEARGQRVQRTPPPSSEQIVPYVNPRSGEVSAVPYGVSPGFAYNPGKERDAALYETMLRKAMDSGALPGAVAVAQAIADHAGFVRQASVRFAGWVDNVQQRGQPRGEMQHVGVISPPVLRALRDRGAGPQGSVISVADADVLHALRDAKVSGLTLEQYRQLPELITRPLAVLREVKADPQVLLYVFDLPGEAGHRAGKLVVQLDQVRKVRVEGRRHALTLNMVRTATVMGRSALEDRATYDLLWGRIR